MRLKVAPDLIFCGVSVFAIEWHQRVVSPHKGFACAYPVKSGGESCSQFARHMFETGDWLLGVRAVKAYFQLCSDAAGALRRERGFDRENRIPDESSAHEQAVQMAKDPEGSRDETCKCALR